MFRLIDRYVLKEITGAAVLGLCVWTAIFIVRNFLNLADAWVKGKLTLPDVGDAVLYQVPSVLVLTIPMSVLLGTLIGFSRLSADTEITALRTTGVSYFRLLWPTLVLAILAALLTAGIYMRAVPWSNTKVTDLFSTAARRTDLNREIRPGMWAPLAEGLGAQEGAIFARGVDNSDPDEPWLLDADILLVDRQAGEARHYHAQRARIDRVITGDDTGRFKFVFEGLRTILWKPDAEGEPPKITEARSGEHVLAERRMSGVRSAASQRKLDKGVRQMTLGELRAHLVDLQEMDRIDELKKKDPVEAQRQQAGRRVSLVPQVRERSRNNALMEIHKKFSIPVACLVFALVAMPLGISTRRGGRPASFAISIAVVILWWLIYDAGSTWALAGRLSPAAGAWLPDVVIGVVAIHALIVQRRQQAVGLYRALRDGLLLGGLVMAMLTVVFLWERRDATIEGRAIPELPPWAPILAGAFLAAHVVTVILRDPLSKFLADLSEAFRRPRAPVREDGGEAHRPDELEPLVDTAGTGALDAVMPDSCPLDGSPGSLDDGCAAPPAIALSEKDRKRWRRRHLLERLRGALVFCFLAMVAFCVVEAFQHEEGPIAGAQALLTSWEPIVLALLAAGCVGLQIAGVRVVSTLDWWVVSSLTKSFATVLAAMIAIYLVFQYLDLADTVLQNKVSAMSVLSYFWHLVPRIVIDVLPFAGMVAVLVTFGIMAKFNETTAVRCGGVSVWRAVLPAVLLAGLACCGAFVLNDYVLPRANQRAEDLKREMQGAPPLRRTTRNSFLMASDGRTLYQFRSVVTHGAGAKQRDQITGLTILVPDASGRIEGLWTATDAEWREDQWVLRNGWHAVIDQGNQVRVDPFGERPLRTLERPEYFAATRRHPSQMAYAELSRYVDEQKAAGFPTASLRVDLQKKVAFPVATLILVLVGLPFAFTGGRRGALYGVGIALILAVLYLAMVAFFTAMGSAEYMPPLAAAWAPNAIFGMAGVYMLLHVRT